ncbi:MAG: dTDP-4-dehydrorhamnose reductase [Acetobacteraceae bacterium]|nr:dTDP-4-dehydrorhamnose reductase [Acetobacteraceae bacterium]
MRVLVAGRDGQLARALVPAFAGAGWRVSALGRADGLDLAGPAGDVMAAVRAAAPDLVVNAAAYTAVDRAESEAGAALAVNRDGAAALAAGAASCRAPVLHVSTDYVFDGSKGAPYAETDEPAPIGAYGRSKLEGERAVADANPRAAILRTSWVVSATGQNFLRTMLRLAETRDEVSVVDDQRGAPTFAADLAAAVLRMAPRLAASPAGDPAFGVFHLSGAPDTTWHGFAEAIFAGAAARGRRVPKLNAIPTSAYPTPTRRPADSRLDCSRILAVHGVGRPFWRPSLARCLDELLPAGAPVPA